jgi:heptaprenyl diphosphate synthase
MVTLSGKNACLHELNGPSLAQVFRPVSCDLQAVQERLAETLRNTNDPFIREIVDYLLESPGKRVRPALALLSARAACGAGNGSPEFNGASISVAAAVELIHMASLVHDDLIDGAAARHHRASIQAKWGKRISVAVGDHLCAKAFQLVADCADPRLFALLGSQLRVMCRGEIEQVLGRGDFGFSERRCLALVEKKTAALFGACCGAGAVTTVGEPMVWKAL